MTEEVRLKGFSRRAPLGEVLAWIQTNVSPLGLDRVPFRDALGRVLAEDVISARNVPPFPRAAMDGYAVRSADVPGTLAVRGELTAAVETEDHLHAQETLRVMTGARIPPGADAVVMIEHARFADGRITVDDPSPAGKHILAIGEDIAAGQSVLSAGRRVRPADVALLVQAGVLEVVVRRRPRVVILPTGSELQPTGRPLLGAQVVESNAFMLEALARRDGADPILHPIVQDDPDRIRAVMANSGADVLVLSGGSSVGREDFTPVVANEIGNVAFHGVALKPGSSLGLARVGPTWVVLGPGYPVAAYVAWDLLVRPLLAALAGTVDRWPYKTLRARLAEAYSKKEGRTEIARVVLEPDGDGVWATPLPGGSAILSTLTEGDGFLCLGDELGPLREGDEVDVHLYD